MRKISLVVLVLLVACLLFYLQFAQKKETIIAAGASNPGRIFLYQYANGNYTKTTLYTDTNLIYTVRVGDIYNDGKGAVVAGVGNDISANPLDCKIISYEFNGYWKKSVIDDIQDLRCKDITIGDAYTAGKNSIVLVTHGLGQVITYTWNGTGFDKQTVDSNYIARIDQARGLNHIFTNAACYPNCTIQTAVHIVKIADVDGDGKNEIVATESTPIDLPANVKDITFIIMYKWDGRSWTSSVVDEDSNIRYPGLAIGNIYNNATVSLVRGTGGDYVNALVYTFTYNGKTWQKTLIDNQTYHGNKGVDVGDVYNNGTKSILVGTGVPGYVNIYTWNEKNFVKQTIDNINDHLPPKLQSYVMASEISDVDNDGKNEIVVGGYSYDPTTTAIASWTKTSTGFLMVYKWNDTSWEKTFVDNSSILGMGTGKIST